MDLEILKAVGAVVGALTGVTSLTWQVLKARAERSAKPRVHKRISGQQLEISYNQSGPSLYLSISYRTEVKNAFVDRVEVIFTNAQTNETHVLEAGYFMEYRIDPTQQATVPRLGLKEPFTPFAINTDRYESKILLFSDPECAETIATELGRLQPIIYRILRDYPEGTPDDVVDGYNASPLRIDTSSRIRDAMYLRPGAYNAKVRSYVEDQVVEEEFAVAITQEQYDTLTTNAIALTSMPHWGSPSTMPFSVFTRMGKPVELDG